MLQFLPTLPMLQPGKAAIGCCHAASYSNKVVLCCRHHLEFSRSSRSSFRISSSPSIAIRQVKAALLMHNCAVTSGMMYFPEGLHHEHCSVVGSYIQHYVCSEPVMHCLRTCRWFRTWSRMASIRRATRVAENASNFIQVAAQNQRRSFSLSHRVRPRTHCRRRRSAPLFRQHVFHNRAPCEPSR